MGRETYAPFYSNPDYHIFLRKAGLFSYLAQYCYDFHTHAEMELLVVQSGCCETDIGSETVVTHPGEGLIVYRHVRHNMRVVSACTAAQLEFQLVGLPCSPALAFFSHMQNRRYDTLFGCEDVADCIRRIDCARDDRDLLELYFLELYTLLSNHLLKDRRPAMTFRNPGFQEVLLAIQDHLSEPLELEKICACCRVSPRAFRKAVRRQTGLPPSLYIQRLRVQAAKALLQDRRLSMDEIARRAGFSSQQYFSRVFKQAEGLTPSQYRKSYYNDEYRQSKRYYG